MNLIVLIILILLSGFFSGIEIAFFSISELRVRYLLEKKTKGSFVLSKLKSNPQRLLVTILIGNNLVNIMASSIAAVWATQFFGSKGLGIATGAMTFLILVFGEITPKSLATIYNEKIALLSAKPVLFLTYILFPVVILFEYLAKFLNKIHPQEAKFTVAEEELETLARMEVEKGHLEHQEEEMIGRVFHLNDINVKEVMTPRKKVVAWKSKNKLSEAIDYLTECQFSRIPVYKKSIDNIIGIVYLKKILKLVKDDNLNITLGDMAAEPVFINEDEKIDDVFRKLRRKHTHMAVVLGKDKRLAGIVTLEDILEELVGEIIDEKDKEEFIEEVSPEVLLIDGDITIGEVNKKYKLEFSWPEDYSLNWMIEQRLGRVPDTGERIEFEKAILVIEDSNEGRVKKVKILKK